VDDSIREEQADVTAVLKDGRREHVFVKHAIGSLERPMTDADLERKFHSLADHTIGEARASKLIEACWKVAELKDVKQLTQLAS
jgi:2-methylcitrate dehydratase PrpD